MWNSLGTPEHTSSTTAQWRCVCLLMHSNFDILTNVCCLGGAFTDGWCFQIFRKLDGLAGDIERSQPPVDLWRKFVYCTSLSGSVLGSVDHMKQEGQFSSSHVECLMSCTSPCMSSDKYFWQILTRSLVLFPLHISRSTS